MDISLLDKKILVGLISHNRLDFTKTAIDTIMDTKIPFDLLIVDNGSEPETKNNLFQLAQDYSSHFVSIENRNCNGARDVINHYGLNYDFVVYVDNDVVMPENWLEILLSNALKTNSAIIGVSQSEFESEETFFGFFKEDKSFIRFIDSDVSIKSAEQVDWVSGHTLMIRGDFLRGIWLKYELWERRHLFPIDLDDIDLMMMARAEGEKVFVAPLVVPQNRGFKNQTESNNYNADRNDFHNYAQSCVSFWQEWGLNPLLNWNNGYSGNVNKPGLIKSYELLEKFNFLVDMLEEVDKSIFDSFKKKLVLV
jgi:GT2 family glycosyltransferase